MLHIVHAIRVTRDFYQSRATKLANASKGAATVPGIMIEIKRASLMDQLLADEILCEMLERAASGGLK
jgi:hypothetical protein